MKNLSFVTLIFTATSSMILGAGVAVQKEQSFHSDASAKVFLYTNAVDLGAAVRFEIKGETVTISRERFIDFVEITHLPISLIKKEEVEALRKDTNLLTDFHNKYEKSRSILAPYVESRMAMIKKFDAGMRLENGKWFTSQEYASVLSQRRQEKENELIEGLKLVRNSEKERWERQREEKEREESLRKAMEQARLAEFIDSQEKANKLENGLKSQRQMLDNLGGGNFSYPIDVLPRSIHRQPIIVFDDDSLKEAESRLSSKLFNIEANQSQIEWTNRKIIESLEEQKFQKMIENGEKMIENRDY